MSWAFQRVIFNVIDEIIEVFRRTGPLNQAIASLHSIKGLVLVGRPIDRHPNLLVLLKRERPRGF